MGTSRSGKGEVSLMTLILFLLATVWILGFCLLPKVAYVRHWTNAVFPLAAITVVNTMVAAAGNFDVVDKTRYGLEFQSLSFTPFGEVLNDFVTTGREPAFLVFTWIVGIFTHDPMVFFVVTAVICNLALVLGLWLLLGSGWQTAVVFYLTFCFGFFVDYSSFLLRQGLSMACLLIAVALVMRSSRPMKILLVLTVGICFHWSALAPAIVILLVRFLRMRPGLLLGVWAVLSLTYFTGVNARLADPLGSSIEQVENYANPDLAANYAGGTNRPTFWILSAVPLAVGYPVSRLMRGLPSWYSTLLNTYILLNCYYLLLGFVYFSDRLAAYSWALIPVLIAVPFLSYAGRGGTMVRAALLAGFAAWGLYFGSFGVLTAS